MKLLRWDGSLRKHEPSVPCSILLSNNYVTIKTCSRNINRQHNLAYSKKITQQVPVTLFFQDLPSFLGKEKLVKCTYFVTGHCFSILFPSSLNFCYLGFNYITTAC